MATILICYHSKSGRTKQMAEAVAEGVGKEAILKPVAETAPEDLLDADAIIIGSPCYFGSPTSEVLQLFESIGQEWLGQLAGKVGGAFSSALYVGGGAEQTVLSLLHLLIAQGMIVQGLPDSDHFGPISVGAPPTEEVLERCRYYGRIITELTKKTASTK